jgi:hypothetical protein
MRSRILPILLLALLPRLVIADDWPGPQVTNVFSPDGAHFVRITPGSSLGDTQGFEGAGKGAYARGAFYEQRPDGSFRIVADVELLNPIAPVDALVTDRGELITFDNWHNMGFGAVVAMYDPKGRLLASFTLEDLYGEEKLARIPTSISSRWWRCDPLGFVDPSQQTKVYVHEQLGGSFVFSFPSHSFEYSPGEADCQTPKGPLSATWLGAGS